MTVCSTCFEPECMGALIDQAHVDATEQEERAVDWLLRLRQLQREGLGFDEALAIANEEDEARDAYRVAGTPAEAEDAVNELARLHRPATPAPVFGP